MLTIYYLQVWITGIIFALLAIPQLKMIISFESITVADNARFLALVAINVLALVLIKWKPTIAWYLHLVGLIGIVIGMQVWINNFIPIGTMDIPQSADNLGLLDQMMQRQLIVTPLLILALINALVVRQSIFTKQK